MPSTTPIAWTRGLNEDGTWSEQGTYGSKGGFIVFMGGNINQYKSLDSAEGGFLVRPDGTRTNNILEALPPGTRVVGSGPGTLHGSTGAQTEK